MSDHLPQEVVLEILHRLPVKSLVKFTTVWRAWNSLITDPTFLYDHLNHTIQAPNGNSSFFFQFCFKEYPHSLHQDDFYLLYSSVKQQNDHFSVKSFPLCHLFEPDRDTLFVGTCSGLVCSVDYSPLNSATIIVWNPLLGKYLVLPKPITTCEKCELEHYDKYDLCIGFGFDFRDNDCKVVRLMNYPWTEDTPHVEVYPVASDIWRSISVTVP